MRTEMVLDPWVGHRSSNLARLADLTGLENRSSMQLVILNYAYTKIPQAYLRLRKGFAILNESECQLGEYFTSCSF